MKRLIPAVLMMAAVSFAGCVTVPTGGGTTTPVTNANADKAADLYNLGMIAFNSGNLEVSLDYVNQAMAVGGADKPTQMKMRRLRAEIFTNLENYDQARTEIAGIIADSPDSADGYFISGLLNFKTGNLNAAETELTRALTIDPSFARAHNLLGNIKKDRGDLDGAIASYNNAVVADNTFAPAYFNRAEIDMAQGHYDSAVSDYSSAIGRYTDLQKQYQAQAYCGRAKAFLMLGNAEMSQRDRNKADLLSPGICVEEKPTTPRWGKGEIRPQ